MKQLLTFAFLLHIIVVAQAQVPSEPAGSHLVEHCITYLAQPEMQSVMPHLEDPTFRYKACDCAQPKQERDARAVMRADPHLVDAVRAAKLLSCIAESVASSPLMAPRANALTKRLAAAVGTSFDTKDYRPPTLRMGEEGCTPPDYPEHARKSGAEGTTVLSVLVSPKGDPMDVSVVSSAGPMLEHKLLDYRVVMWTLACTFHPAQRGGSSTFGWTNVAFDWKLQ